MLKNLKSLFIVEEDDEKESLKKTNDKAEKQTIPNKELTKKTTTTATTNVPGNVDSKIIDKLLQAIEKSNLEGFDYLEFKKAIKALEKIPMDEATKYRSTFATASTMGVTLEKLIETVHHYIGILDKENETFTKAFEGQITQNIENKEKEISQFEAIIKEKSEKIKQLTEQINKHQKQIEDLKSVVNESKNKIEKTKNDFKLSYLNLKTQFEQDVEKMNKYLK